MTLSQRRRLRIWLAAIAAMTLLVLVVGGITRLTHSGLSIVEWRPVVGIVPPLSQADWTASFERYQQFPEYRHLRADMTLAEYRRIFYWEYLHRLLARVIGLVFIIPFAFFCYSRALTRQFARRALALFALGGLQGVAGWLMVRSGLIDRPSVSHYRLALHLVLALAIFGWCIWLIQDLGLGTARIAVTAEARRGLRRALMVVGCVLGLQIVWGAFVAGLKAGFRFNTFPLMTGGLVPWVSTPGLRDFVQDPSVVQWMHRLLGTVLVTAALWLCLRAWRSGVDRSSQRLCVALLSAIGAQYALGILTLIHLVPIGLGVAHQALAMAIAGLWVSAVHHVQHLAVATPHALPGSFRRSAPRAE